MNDYRLVGISILLLFAGFVAPSFAVLSPAGEEVNLPQSIVPIAPKVGLPYSTGDVFVSVANGMVKQYDGTGVFIQDILCGPGASGFTTGSAFDSDMNFYVTMFSNNAICKNDDMGNFVSNFGVGAPFSSPESLVFDAAGNLYNGGPFQDILKFAPDGTLLDNFNIPIDGLESDWIDLAANQCTMFIASEGSNIKRHDVCTDTVLANFNVAPLPGSNAFALRLLNDGGLLVADREIIVRLNAAGVVIDTYDITGNNNWFALNLDPDGNSFWSADFGTSQVCKFDIATGGGVDNELLCFNTGTGGNTVFGLSLKGEITQALCPPGTHGTPPNCIPDMVGGEFLPIDTTALLVAGAQTNAFWILSALAGIASVAFATLYIKTKRE